MKETIIQFGEGNFLRAFVEYYLEKTDTDQKVVICQPRTNTKVIDALKKQNCQYSINIRGLKNGKVINERMPVNCVSRCIDSVGEYQKLQELFKSDDLRFVVSNTTEAGITFNETDKEENYPYIAFPGKVTMLLKSRFECGKKGLIFLPTELIEDNGTQLKKCILKYADLWNLGDDFKTYVENECVFCNTLVDRIVSGHNSSDDDPCSVDGEPFGSFIIECDEKTFSFLPFKNEDIVRADSLKTYRERKVKILNGAHTMSVPAGLLSGITIVRDMMNDALFNEYIEKGLAEVSKTIDLPKENIDSFAASVKERFSNPFIDHKLESIVLNSLSKFKVRVLPSILDYVKSFGEAPKVLTFSLAALIYFYKNGNPNDNAEAMEYLKKESIENILKSTELWDCDLSFLLEITKENYNKIETEGIREAMKWVI